MELPVPNSRRVPPMSRGTCRLAAAREQGIALIIVLWLIVLMSVIATGHSRNVHLETRLAHRHVDAAKARHVAEAAMEITVLRLLTAGQDSTEAGWRRVYVFDREALVSVRRADGLVDLNAAGDRLLAALFIAAGATEGDAGQLADTVQDWRDADDIPRLNGAEDEDYRALGLPWTAGDRDFRHVDELRFIPGMTGDLFAEVAPFVTVHSGRAGVDISQAPEALVAALTESRLPTGYRAAGSAGDELPYHISISVMGAGDTRVSIDAVIRLGGERDEKFTVLEWRESTRQPANTAKDLET